MMTFDRDTGEGLNGWPACAARIKELVTTELGERFKRSDFGVRHLLDYGSNLTESYLIRLQNDVLRALKSKGNGISEDFKVSRVFCDRSSGFVELKIFGEYLGEKISVTL